MEQIEDLTVFIARDGAGLITDSRAVALAFKKRHKNVLRIIDAMAQSSRPEIVEHRRLNFEPTKYTVPGPKGAARQEAMYKMTAKGLSELAMSFSGDDARVIRLRFLSAFETVANRLAAAERSISEMLHDWERRELPSATKGKIGSRLMHERRKEKPVLARERDQLQALAQPALPGLAQAPALQVIQPSASASNDEGQRRSG